jgi:hypothetical protein
MKAPDFLQNVLESLLDYFKEKDVTILASEIHDTKLGLYAFVTIENTIENFKKLETPEDILHSLTDIVLWYKQVDYGKWQLFNWEYIEKRSRLN